MSAWLRRVDRTEIAAMLFVAGFVFLVPAVPLAISIVVSPEAIERGDVQLSPPCPTLVRTGHECPTCGMTRGFAAMSRLRIGDAIEYNAGAPWLWLFCWIVILASGSLLARLGAEIVRRYRAHAPSTSQLSPVDRPVSAILLSSASAGDNTGLR